MQMWSYRRGRRVKEVSQQRKIWVDRLRTTNENTLIMGQRDA